MRAKHERKLEALRRAANANPGITAGEYLAKLRDLLREMR